MRIHLVEVLEGRRQLRQQRARVTQVHARHIAAIEGVDEALGHSVALWATDGRVDGLEPQCVCQSPRVSCDVVTPLLPRNSTSRPCGTASTEQKRRSTASMSISRTGSRQPFTFSRPRCHDLAVAVFRGEGGRHCLA